jgi:hypothetical protein
LPSPSARRWSVVEHPPGLRPSACCSGPLLLGGLPPRVGGRVPRWRPHHAATSLACRPHPPAAAASRGGAPTRRLCPSGSSGSPPSATGRTRWADPARARRCGESRGCRSGCGGAPPRGVPCAAAAVARGGAAAPIARLSGRLFSCPSLSHGSSALRTRPSDPRHATARASDTVQLCRCLATTRSARVDLDRLDRMDVSPLAHGALSAPCGTWGLGDPPTPGLTSRMIGLRPLVRHPRAQIAPSRSSARRLPGGTGAGAWGYRGTAT